MIKKLHINIWMETDEYDEMSLCLGASLNVVGVYAVPYEKGFS